MTTSRILHRVGNLALHQHRTGTDKTLRAALVTLVFAVGCTASPAPERPPKSPGWDGSVRQWGTLREVMHGEVLDGQVRLADVLDQPHVYGIGAPDKLRGEIVIADSAAWVAEVVGADRIETRPSAASDSAVFLAIARVPRWTEAKADHDVAADQFDDFIRETLRRAGLAEPETIPFVIEGRLRSLKLHVLNGQCPFAEVKAGFAGSSPPQRATVRDVQGLLVGFYSEHGAGRITHHSSRTHVHALLGSEGDRLAGHVDAVALRAGAIVRVPVSSRPTEKGDGK